LKVAFSFRTSGAGRTRDAHSSSEGRGDPGSRVWNRPPSEVGPGVVLAALARGAAALDAVPEAVTGTTVEASKGTDWVGLPQAPATIAARARPRPEAVIRRVTVRRRLTGRLLPIDDPGQRVIDLDPVSTVESGSYGRDR
jgi:hypothetical protein